MNRFDLLGNVTKDIETSKAGDATVARFQLAINRPFKNKEGNYDTDFVWVKAWNKDAENIAKFVKKGDKLRVEGRIQTSTTEKDGEKQYFTDLVVTSYELLGKKPETTESK